LVLKFI